MSENNQHVQDTFDVSELLADPFSDAVLPADNNMPSHCQTFLHQATLPYTSAHVHVVPCAGTTPGNTVPLHSNSFPFAHHLPFKLVSIQQLWQSMTQSISNILPAQALQVLQHLQTQPKAPSARITISQARRKKEKKSIDWSDDHEALETIFSGAYKYHIDVDCSTLTSQSPVNPNHVTFRLSVQTGSEDAKPTATTTCIHASNSTSTWVPVSNNPFKHLSFEEHLNNKCLRFKVQFGTNSHAYDKKPFILQILFQNNVVFESGRFVLMAHKSTSKDPMSLEYGKRVGKRKYTRKAPYTRKSKPSSPVTSLVMAAVASPSAPASPSPPQRPTSPQRQRVLDTLSTLSGMCSSLIKMPVIL